MNQEPPRHLSGWQRGRWSRTTGLTPHAGPRQSAGVSGLESSRRADMACWRGRIGGVPSDCSPRTITHGCRRGQVATAAASLWIRSVVSLLDGDGFAVGLAAAGGEVCRATEDLGACDGGALLEGLGSGRLDADGDLLPRPGAADVLEGRALGDA
jgi:hypothetical protein